MAPDDADRLTDRIVLVAPPIVSRRLDGANGGHRENPGSRKAIALERIATLLRVGGVFRVRDRFFARPLSEVHDVVEAWLASASDRPEDSWTRAELETHLRDAHSTCPWLFEPMLMQAGFEVRDAMYSDSRISAEYTCVRVR